MGEAMTCHYCGATVSECCRGQCECAKDFAGCVFYMEELEPACAGIKLERVKPC